MSPSFDDIAYEQVISEGIIAVKAGHFEQARRLLEKATLYNRPDARPWLALAETTGDPVQKRKYIECAVAADPFDSAARRSMVNFSEDFDRSRVMPQGQGLTPQPSPEPEEAESQETTCPKCGGRLHFDPESTTLVCEYCGYTSLITTRSAADEGEQAFDLTLPTTRAHRWAEAQERLQCGRCGAVSLLIPGQKSSQCSYCGSNQLVEAPGSIELVDPQGLALMRIDSAQASRAVRRWLSKGTFIPDDLRRGASQINLRPAYYPFWTFDGILEVSWNCQVNVGTSRAPRWESRSGVEMELFDDVLVPGLKSLIRRHVDSVGPFALKDIVGFEPHLLAGWTALGYDRSLADASLDARELIVNQLRRSLNSRVEPGREKRSLSTGGGKWGALTYKHILLPLWIGSYTYHGKIYPLLVNGQTAKVVGDKPRDSLKIWLLAFTGLFLILILIMVVVMSISR